MSYRVEVNTAGEPPDSWAGNDITHETPEKATAAAKDLFMRWTAVNYWRVVDAAGTVVDSNKEEAS